MPSLPAAPVTEISVEFTATRADMSAFQRFVTARIRASVRTPIYWLVLVLGAVLAGAVLSGALGVHVEAKSAAVVAVLVPAIWWPLSRLYRLAAAPGETGSLVGPRTITLSEDGVRQLTPLHRGFTAWEGVLDVVQAGGYLFLMTDTLAGYVIPRRAFATDEAWSTLGSVAKARMVAARPGASS